jgi:hypothetical protein
MTELVFYRQMRVDGGVRTGISIDRSTGLERFEPGPDEDESDPVLLWFIDVRCKASSIPREPEEARQWLIANAPWIVTGLDQVAEELSVGVDHDILPFQRPIPEAPAKIHAQVVGSAMRRIDATEIAVQIRSIRRHWKRLLASLEPAGV